MKIKKNDEVIVISGKNKGESGRIISIDHKTEKVKIQDINKVTKHVKPSQQKNAGGIEHFEAGIHVSNIALKVKTSKLGKKDSKSSNSKSSSTEKVSKSKWTKVGFKFDDKGKKIRFEKRTGKSI